MPVSCATSVLSKMKMDAPKSTALKTILKLIPQLSLEEAKAVMRMLEFQHPQLLAPKKLSRESALFYESMKKYLEATLGVGLPDARYMESCGYYSNFTRGWDLFSPYLTKLNFSDDISRIRFYNKCFPILVNYLKDTDVPVTPVSAINTISNCPWHLTRSCIG